MNIVFLIFYVFIVFQQALVCMDTAMRDIYEQTQGVQEYLLPAMHEKLEHRAYLANKSANESSNSLEDYATTLASYEIAQKEKQDKMKRNLLGSSLAFWGANNVLGTPQFLGRGHSKKYWPLYYGAGLGVSGNALMAYKHLYDKSLLRDMYERKIEEIARHSTGKEIAMIDRAKKDYIQRYESTIGPTGIFDPDLYNRIMLNRQTDTILGMATHMISLLYGQSESGGIDI